MDKTTLVRSDLEVLGQIQGALSRAAVPVSLVEVDYISQLDEWQIFVATPLYDTKGPGEANSRVLNALKDAGIYQDAPIRRIFVKSPTDPVVKKLEAEVKVRNEGAIHILAHTRPNRTSEYAVIFAPFAGPGGAVPSKRFDGPDELRKFLENQVGISRSSVDEAFSEIGHKGSASVFHVQLTRKEAKRLGLA